MADSTFHNKESLIHPTRAIQFLVGVRGKNEAMAIGGSWSPSLDGPDPGSDPSVLVKTAIRACKALTGIDLSSCTKWCRFLEIHYRRQESSTKPARTETTVIYLPDIWSVMPSSDEFQKLQEVYAEALDAKINPKKKEDKKKAAQAKDCGEKTESEEQKKEAGDENGDGKKDESKKDEVGEEGEKAADEAAKNDEDDLDEQEAELMKSEMAEEDALKADVPQAAAAATVDNEAASDEKKEESGEEKMETAEVAEEEAKEETTEEAAAAKEGEEEAKDEEVKPEATSWKELDVKTLKVNDLRSELDARGLNSKGVKSQLVVRLQKALKQEEKAEKEKGEKEGETAAASDEKEKEGGEPATADKDDEKSGGEEKMDVSEPEPKEKDESAVSAAKEASADDDKNKDDKAKEDDKAMEDDKAKEDDKKDDSKAKEDDKKANEDRESPEIIMEVKGTDDESVFVKPAVALDEKQKAALTTAYKMPAKPCVLVHPHPKAKSGKFDCTVMSLSVLLDYRTDDNKEGTFEVSLFAELFNEMMMRDSGFKMYRAIVDHVTSPPKKEEETKDDVTAEVGEEGKKMVTRNKELLMACSYFDLGHGGYIEIKDVEDILQATTLSLSRAQIKKLVTKAAATGNGSAAGGQKDRLNYRQFTDKPENEEPKPIEMKSREEEQKIGLGFKAFLPKADESAEASSSATTSTTAISASGICSYKGTVVDIGKLMSQLERSEREKFDSESRLEATQKILSNFKEAAEKHNNVKDKLQTELKDVKKRLRSTEDELKKVQTESTKFLNTITHVYNRVSPIAAPQATASATPDSPATAASSKEVVKTNDKEMQNGKSVTPEASKIESK